MPRLAALSARALDKLASGWRRLSGAVPRIIYNFYVDENPDYGACALAAGSGRGGTTWLAEIINYDNSYRFMFEPFDGNHVPECAAFGQCQYLRPEDNDLKFLGPARSIFSGRLRNGWVDAYNRRLRVTRRLVKDIRVNLLLGWIRAHFPEIPIVLLLRHPCAVAHSRCRTRWHEDLEGTFFNQPSLVEDYIKPFLPAAKNLGTEFERHVFSWCIETYVPLMQLEPEEMLVVTYEDCVLSPATEVQRVFNHLQKPFDADVLRNIRKPSSQSRRNWRSGNASAIVTGDGVLDSWQRFVDRDSAKRALEILKLFGLDEIYGLDPLPHSASIGQFMRYDKANRYNHRT